MAKVLRLKDGTKLYPVCGFQRSQHKLYYWYNKACLNAFYCDSDYTPTEKDYEEFEFWNNVMEYANCVHDGLIYMPWEYYNRVKEAIVVYDLRH